MASPLFVAQQVFSAMTSNSGASPQCSNGTTPNSPTTAAAPFQFPTDFGSLISFLFGFSALREWLKLIVIGSLLETFRRIGFYLYYKAYSSLFITARFDEDDLPYSWLMFWLTQQDTFKNSARYVQVTSHSYGVSGESVLIDGEEKDPSQVVDGARPLAFLPAIDTSHTMWYRRHWMRVVRYVREGDYGRKEQTVEICICTFGYSILNELLLEAKKAYNIARENRISIFVSDSQNNWRLVSSRPKRSLKSIVLDPGVKDLLIQDASDFLQSKSWYSARGIPFRRGYLLYGAPGSGKTSIIHSLAGELGLNVYVISLSRFGLDDTALSSLIAELPEKCIALMEDIDAAFNQTLTREDNDDKSDDPQKKQQKQTVSAAPVIQTSRVSLSGLLNALDGVGAQEGRILFATTNKYHALDPALCRPGRMDLHIEFKLASKFQAGELFKCFYLPEEEEEQVQNAGRKSEKEENDSGYGSGSDVDEKSPLTPSSPPPSPPSTASSGLVFGSSHRTRCPKLSTEQVDTLAAEFASAVPEREFSMAALQGYLMSYKVRPFEAAKDIAAWIEKERQEKKRLEDMNKKKAENSPDTPPKPEDTSKSGEGEVKVAEPSKDSTTSAPVKVEDSAASS